MIGVNADTSTGMVAIGRMQVVVRGERVSHLYLCTPERQSLCESHRQRRWLTCWSYGAPGCLSLAGTVLDNFVAAQGMQVLAPASLALSLAAEQALRAERAQLE